MVVPYMNAKEIYGREQVLDVDSAVISDSSGNHFPAIADDALHVFA